MTTTRRCRSGGPTMRALVFGAATRRPTRRRPQPTDDLERMLAALPFGLHVVDDARPPRPDWVVTQADPVGHLRIRRQARAGRLRRR